MGYTHYFSMHGDKATDQTWGKLCNIANAIIEKSSVKIRDGLGVGTPVIDSKCIFINGDASKAEQFETFHIERNRDSWGRIFCKTGRRPYDEVVVAILIVAQRLNILTWDSDGEDKLKDFDDAKKLLDSLS